MKAIPGSGPVKEHGPLTLRNEDRILGPHTVGSHDACLVATRGGKHVGNSPPVRRPLWGLSAIFGKRQAGVRSSLDIQYINVTRSPRSSRSLVKKTFSIWRWLWVQQRASRE